MTVTYITSKHTALTQQRTKEANKSVMHAHSQNGALPACDNRRARAHKTGDAVFSKREGTWMQSLMLWRSPGKASLMPLPRCCRAANLAVPSCFSCSLCATAAAIYMPSHVSASWLCCVPAHKCCCRYLTHTDRRRYRQTEPHKAQTDRHNAVL